MQAGSSLEECLALYPHFAVELEPLLTTAALAQQMRRVHVPASASHRSRSLFLKKARDFERRPASILAGRGSPRLVLAAFSLLLVIFLSLNGLIVASAKTLPGDTLYAVKRAAETVRLQLVSNTEIKHRMENDYNLRRAVEVKELLALQRVEHISFEGRVDQIQGQRWVVEGILIHASEKTQRIGNIQTGDFIEVEGVTNPSGWIDADELHQRYFNLTGAIQAMSRSAWVVSGVELAIQKDTQFDPGLHIGDQALALVYSSDDGRFFARAILSYNPIPFQPFQIKFNGVIESIDGNLLIIDGRQVKLDAQTVLEGNLIPGVEVIVVSLVAQDGSLTALLVSVQQRQEPAPVIGPGDYNKVIEIVENARHEQNDERLEDTQGDASDDREGQAGEDDTGDKEDDKDDHSANDHDDDHDDDQDDDHDDDHDEDHHDDDHEDEEDHEEEKDD
jgi:hypothetical protein